MFDPTMYDTPPADGRAASKAMSALMLELIRGVEEHAEKEDTRLTSGLMRRSLELIDLTQDKLMRFAGDKTGTVTLDTLKAANETLDRATAILTDFLTEHPTPELTCFDRETTPIRPL